MTQVPAICGTHAPSGIISTPGAIVTYEKATFVPPGGSDLEGPPLVVDCAGVGANSAGPFGVLSVDIYAKGITDLGVALNPNQRLTLQQQLAKLGGVTLKSDYYVGGSLSLTENLKNDGEQNHNLSVDASNLTKNGKYACGTFTIQIWVGNQEVSSFAMVLSDKSGRETGCPALPNP